jgi:hypothetical protein
VWHQERKWWILRPKITASRPKIAISAFQKSTQTKNSKNWQRTRFH